MPLSSHVSAIPMLPALLCEDLCSLNPGVDRLAFSVIWRMTQDAQVLETRFEKSIIRWVPHTANSLFASPFSFSFPFLSTLPACSAGIYRTRLVQTNVTRLALVMTRSCAKLAYDDAQEVIEGRPLPESAVVHGQERADVEA